MMTLTELIKDNYVKFLYYRDGQFMYKVDVIKGYDPNFQFPVPLADIGTATLNARDKAILFMRWIRKQWDLMQQDEAIKMYSELSVDFAEELGIK